MTAGLLRRAYFVPDAVRIVVPPHRNVKWTAERRMHVAMANNNRAPWYTAISRYTVADLERKFAEGSVATVLYYTTGGLLGDPKLLRTEGGYYVHGQWTRMDGDILLSLSDLGVNPVGVVAWSEAIKHP